MRPARASRSFDLPTTQGAFQIILASSDPTIWGDIFVARFGEGTGVVNPPPPPPTRTDTFSGEIDKEQTIRHFANVLERGTIEIDLNWDESRADLDLRAIHTSTDTVVFEDLGSDRPKQVSFHNDLTDRGGWGDVDRYRNADRDGGLCPSCQERYLEEY